jgi:hypothetical protein
MLPHFCIALIAWIVPVTSFADSKVTVLILSLRDKKFLQNVKIFEVADSVRVFQAGCSSKLVLHVNSIVSSSTESPAVLCNRVKL